MDKIPVSYVPFVGTDGRLHTRPERVLEPVNMEMCTLRRPPQLSPIFQESDERAFDDALPFPTRLRDERGVRSARARSNFSKDSDKIPLRFALRARRFLRKRPVANPAEDEAPFRFIFANHVPAKERRFAIMRRRERLTKVLRDLAHLD